MNRGCVWQIKSIRNLETISSLQVCMVNNISLVLWKHHVNPLWQTFSSVISTDVISIIALLKIRAYRPSCLLTWWCLFDESSCMHASSSLRIFMPITVGVFMLICMNLHLYIIRIFMPIRTLCLFACLLACWCYQHIITISTDEDPSLGVESFAIINLRGVSTKLNWYRNYIYDYISKKRIIHTDDFCFRKPIIKCLYVR